MRPLRYRALEATAGSLRRHFLSLGVVLFVVRLPAVVSQTPSSSVPSTLNGCECTKGWNIADVGSCEGYCCNPDNDPGGKWCMVASVECEDSDWGYCLSDVAPPSQGCTDIFDWTDSDEDTCEDYAVNQWCTKDGEVGLGWHEEWGDQQGFAMAGKTAWEACCACGGGSTTSQAVSSRVTWNGCACKRTWSDEYLGSCASSCCDPDQDPSGDWCFVVDQACEEADWGYCQPASGGGLPAPGPAPAGSSGAPAPAPEPDEEEYRPFIRPGCVSTAGWKDADGDSCSLYAENRWCTDVGGYGLGWHEDWGVFLSFAGAQGPADVSCCECGGGKDAASNSSSTFPFGAGPPVVAGISAGPPQVAGAASGSSDAKARTTWQGCNCKKKWDFSTGPSSLSCESYCCNPDNDPGGSWCVIESAECEGADWGYCRTRGVGTMAAEAKQDMWHCEDKDAWEDKDGDDCDVYAGSAWCTSTGQQGPGWNEEDWGTLSSHANDDGVSAVTACCACGGGASIDPEDAEEEFEFESDEMWSVEDGPCTIDDAGCALSGNFPKPYNPNERCSIAVNPEKAVPIEVVVFNTEAMYDELVVNGRAYSGTRGPKGIMPAGVVSWATDANWQGAGWKLCPRGAVPDEEDEEGPGADKSVSPLKLFALVLVLVVLVAGGCWFRAARLRSQWDDGIGSAPTKYGKSSRTIDEV